MGLLSFVRRYTQAGASIRTADAAASSMNADNLQEAFTNAYGLALTHLAKRTKAGERTSAEHLEVALACAARMEAARGGDGGVEFRVRTRPTMVALLYKAEADYGELIRSGRATGQQAIVEAIRYAGS